MATKAERRVERLEKALHKIGEIADNAIYEGPYGEADALDKIERVVKKCFESRGKNAKR